MMNSKGIKVWWQIGLVAIALVWGCDRVPTDDQGAVLIYQAPRAAVLATVNGEKITAGDFFDRQRLEAAFYRLNKKGKTDLSKPPDEGTAKGLEQLKARRQETLLAELINQLQTRQYLAKSGKALTDARRQEIVAATLKKAKYGESLATLAQAIQVPESFVVLQMGASEEQRVARELFNPACNQVTEDEILRGLKQQDQYKSLAMASNAVTFATCSNLLKQVRAGASFSELGKTHGFAEAEAEEWDTLRHDEFTNKEFEKWAFSAPVGSVGGPFELEDSIGIFKILERQDGMTAPSMAAAEVATVRMARMGFPVIDPEPEPHTPEFVKGVLLDWKRKQAQKKLLEKLNAEAKIVYPHGSKFLYREDK